MMNRTATLQSSQTLGFANNIYPTEIFISCIVPKPIAPLRYQLVVHAFYQQSGCSLIPIFRKSNAMKSFNAMLFFNIAISKSNPIVFCRCNQLNPHSIKVFQIDERLFKSFLRLRKRNIESC